MVAKSLGRDYIGCELNNDYGDFINDRVEPYLNTLENFL